MFRTVNGISQQIDSFLSHVKSEIILIKTPSEDTFISNDIKIIHHLNSRQKVKDFLIQQSGRDIMMWVRPLRLINTYTVYVVQQRNRLRLLDELPCRPREQME